MVAGVQDYGNKIGIPTVNGAVYFDDRYLANPLVFCGCVGLIPRDKIEKAAVKKYKMTNADLASISVPTVYVPGGTSLTAKCSP